MNNPYRYILQPYKSPASRYRCPECNHKRIFTRYVDAGTGEYLADHVGRCSRENKCGYHFKPKEFFAGRESIVGSPESLVRGGKKKIGKVPTKINHGPSTTDYGLFQHSLDHYQNNHFTNWLTGLFGEDVTGELIGKYLIGTSNHWPGATIFWQIDDNGGIRTGKIMLYGDDGKRVKKPFNHITWAHCLSQKSESRESRESRKEAAGRMSESRESQQSRKEAAGRMSESRESQQSRKEAAGRMSESRESRKEALNQLSDFRTSGLSDSPDYNLQQCLFGEHLLKEDKAKPVALVESEKSALIAGVYLPQFVWLAAGSLSNLSAEKCAILKGRNVTLFPDLNGFDKWQLKAKQLGMGFKISSLLEDNATEAEKAEGLDVADYLLKFDHKEFDRDSPKQDVQSQQQEDSKDHGIAAESYSFKEPQAIIKLFASSFKVGRAEVRHRIITPVKSFKRPLWDKEIDELQSYFNSVELPEVPVRINNCTTINNLKNFVNAHFENVRCNNGKPAFLPYLERLREVRSLVEAINVTTYI